MAVLKEDSLKRRRSIAVPSQSRQLTTVPAGRRRPHSIVPGESLNGLDQLRRASFAPRKSILKPSSLVNTDDGSGQLSQPSDSQPPQPDDGNNTESMDFTVDYRARIHDNTSRKSFGRRVSFGEHVSVLIFKKSKHEIKSNENDYPASFSRRRSSVRHSIAGSEDMDLTTASPNLFVGENESALMDQELEFDENDDMDVTEVLRGDMLSRRSLSGRQPFAPVPSRDSIVFPSDDAIPSDDDDIDQTHSTLDSDSQIHSEAEQSQEAIEFTIPMGQSLRPPPTEDPVWLALREMTHAGDTPHESETSEDSIQVDSGQRSMELDDAVTRLMRARDSTGPSTSIEYTTEDMDITNINGDVVVQEDSFLSTDDSLNGDMGNGDETLNVSRIIGRISLGYQDSTMDESDIYDSLPPLPSSTPRPSNAPSIKLQEIEEPSTEPQRQDSSEASRLVLQVPLQETAAPSPAPTAPITVEKQMITLPVFTFVPPSAASPVPEISRTPTKTASLVKLKPKPTFSAAFAPPVTKPSPKKPSTLSTPTQDTPSKRSFSVMQDGTHDLEHPSPAKRPALAQKLAATTPKRGATPSQSRVSLFSNKQNVSNGMSALPTPGRRQSGYFARRKSLGNALAAPRDDQKEGNPTFHPVSPARQTTHNRDSTSSKGLAHFDTSIPAIVVPLMKSQVMNHLDPTSQPTTSPANARKSLGPASTKASEQDFALNSERFDFQSGDRATRDLDDEELEANVAEDVPSMSIQEFFSMTGIKFMDELTAPRRSVHPHTGTHQARNPAEIPLSEYYIAMGIDVPQLGLFTRVSKDLEGWMMRSKSDFAQAEEEAAKITPELFVEFMRADEEGQSELLHQLNLIRVNARGQAKSDWYDWKLRWVQGLQTTATQAFNDLQADANFLEPIKRAAEESIPTLEKEYNDILKVLECEQAEVAEIEVSDQEYLNDLKVSIAEQNIEVEALRAEESEHTEQLNYLQGRLEELAIGRKEAIDAITKAQHVLQMKENSTRTEVFRLRDELEALEDLHRFHVTKVDEAIFEYVYASHFRVSIPCHQYLPVVSSVEIAHIDAPTLNTKDDFPQLSGIFLRTGKTLIHHSRPKSCKEIIHQLSDYWSSCSQLRAQLRLLVIKYPIDIIPFDCGGIPGFRARTKVMIPSKKAKIFVTFNFTPEIFTRWPLSISSLTFDVEVSYGPVSQSTIEHALSARLNQASSVENYACLLDACIEAQEIYNQ